MTEPTLMPRARKRLGLGLGRGSCFAILAAIVALGLTACMPPIAPNNRPSIPKAEKNGALTSTLLVSVRPGCLVHRDAAPGITALLHAATAAGVSLKPVSCYRDLAGQQAARDSWCARDACHMAAVPGTSNHGWGKAVDFGSGTTPFTFASPAYKWLTDNAWQYGWNHPGWAEPTGTSPEAWHWEWVGDGGTLYPGKTIGPQRTPTPEMPERVDLGHVSR